MKKRCGVCKKNRLVKFFHRKNAKYLQNMCVDCRRTYHAMHYSENKSQYRLSVRRRQYEMDEFIRSQKQNPCKDCKNSFHFAAMQFDHLDGKKKVIILSQISRMGWSKERVLEEIAKCDLVCANCHAVRTFQRNLVKCGRRLMVEHQPSKLTE